MKQLNLKGMSIVRDLESEEELDVLRDFLLVDPKNITHQINFWKEECINAPEEEKAEIVETIKSLKNLLKNQARITCRVYSLDEKEVEDTTNTSTVTEDGVDPSKKNLHIVRDDESVDTPEDKVLRKKYQSIIKKINVDALRLKIKELIAENKNDEAKELANFILGKGFYKGKKTKIWSQVEIDKFLKAISTPKTQNKSETEGDEATEDVDLHKKYANYLGDNAPLLDGLKAEVKFLLSNNEVEKGLEVAAFLLTEGLYAVTEGAPFKWSNVQVEDFLKAIKDDIEKNPLVLVPEGSKTIDSETAAAIDNQTAIEKGQPSIENKGEADKVKVDIKMSEFCRLIKEKIVDGKATEEEVKKYIFDTVKEKTVECLDMFKGTESTQQELEDMYTTFFISFVSESYKEKEIKAIDVKEEIIKLIDRDMKAGEEGLSKVIQEALKLYEKRGEKVNIKECKTIVHDICEEKYPEFHKKVMEVLGEKAKAKKAEENGKVAIVQGEGDFEKKHPDIWEEVKGAENLEDVFNMARELEKKQDFLVVSEMITHLISSGKINHSKDKPHPVKWDKAQIELWINSMFKGIPPVNATENPIPPTPPVDSTAAAVVSTKGGGESVDHTSEASQSEAEKVDPTKPAVLDANAPGEQTEGKENVKITVSSSSDGETNKGLKLGETATSATKGESATGPADSTGNASETTDKMEMVYPKDLKVAEGDEGFKELYVTSGRDGKEMFWQGVANIIKRLTAESKSKKEITHDLSDKIKSLSKRDDLTQCFVRNYKRNKINEIYSIVNKIAAAMNVEGWVIA